MAGMIDAMAGFRTLVLGDPALQDRLGTITADDAFVAAVRVIAAEHGTALDAATVVAALRPHPPGMARFMPAPVTSDRWPRGNWIPARSVPTGGAPAFDWIWVGTDRIGDPFFEETVRRYEPRPFNRMFRTRTDFAALIADADPVSVPEGFVLHMSRCGSTLVAQMLGSVPEHLVLSEPEPFDAVLRWATEAGAPTDTARVALRAIAAALGRDRFGATHMVVKLDSWHTAALPLLRAAFPATPWVFVYRDPVEVMVSQMARRGIHTIPGMLPTTFIDVPDAEAIEAEEFVALSLSKVVEAALANRDLGGGIAVGYAELPNAVIDRIAPHFGIRLDRVGQAAMRGAAARDAKEPSRTYAADGAVKRQAATPAIRDAARRYLEPLGHALAAWQAGGIGRR